MKKNQLSKQQAKIVNALSAGALLYRVFDDGEPSYSLDMKSDVLACTATGLIRRGLLRERADAMFGVGMSYELAETA